jgi:hypothetical protein
VNDDDKEHTDRVLEECAKVCKDMTFNWRIQATNTYISKGSEGIGQGF